MNITNERRQEDIDKMCGMNYRRASRGERKGVEGATRESSVTSIMS